MQYDWPGNVRELENCVERAVALGNGHIIDSGDLPPSIAADSPAGSASESAADEASQTVPSLAAEAQAASSHVPLSTTDLEDIERATIQLVHEQAKADKSLAGHSLGITPAL